MLHDDDPRLDAAKGLLEIGRLGQVELLGAVILRAAPEAPEPIAAAAAEALGALGDVRAERALIRLLRHRSGTVRASAIRALGMVGTRRAFQALERVRGRPVRSWFGIGRQDFDALITRAKEEIQARAGVLGNLSLVEDGGMSLSELPSEGRLSTWTEQKS